MIKEIAETAMPTFLLPLCKRFIIKETKLNNLVMTTKNLETVEANEAFEAHYRKSIGSQPSV